MSGETPFDESARLTVPEHVLARKVGGETVLLNLEDEQYYGLESVGTRLWELVEAGTTFGEAVTALLAEFDVQREALVADLTVITLELRERGLVAVDAA